MISRIEIIDDLIMWIESLMQLHAKKVSCEELSDDKISILCKAVTVLQELTTNYPGTFKQCVKCFCVWPETKEWFDYSGQGRTGLHPDCKFCRNAYQKKRKRNSNTAQSNLSDEDQAEIARHQQQEPNETAEIPSDWHPPGWKD